MAPPKTRLPSQRESSQAAASPTGIAASASSANCRLNSHHTRRRDHPRPRSTASVGAWAARKCPATKATEYSAIASSAAATIWIVNEATS